MADRMNRVAGELRLGAALFNGDHGRLAEEVARIEAAGLDFLHLDVFDGYFVSDIGFSPRTIAALRPLTQLPFEVHLGAQNPMHFVPQLRDAGVDLLIFHVESVAMVYESLFTVHEHGMKAGLAFALGTPVSRLQPVVNCVDAILLLARVTGEGRRGAQFDPRVLPRVQAIRHMVDEAHATAKEAYPDGMSGVDVQVAGSVRREHMSSLLAAGVDSLALGGGLYRVPDMAAEVQALRQLATVS